jgi:flagellar motor switch/type III secretory pathway protein FliN
MDPTVNPSSTYVSFSAEAALAENPPGKIMLAYPGSALKALLTKYRQKDAAKPLDFSRLPAMLLAKILAPLSATLGETQLSTDEIHQLETGDVVSLDTSIASPVPLEIGNILKLLGQPGTRNRKAAIRIIGFKETPEVELAPPELAPPPPPPKKPEEIKVPEKEMPVKKIAEELPEEEEEFTEEDLLEEEFPEEEFEEEEELPEEEEFK